MIIITGPGRSGTSFLARVYQELGFSPIVGGGGWDSGIEGGLEDIEVGRLNARVISELGLRSSVSRWADLWRRINDELRRKDRPVGHAGVLTKEEKPQRAQKSIANRVAGRLGGRHIRLMKWDRVGDVVERHGAEMRRLATTREVVKDPAFCLTLGIWAAADANIDFVVVSLRALEATASGLLRTGHLPLWAEARAQDHVVYRLGVLLAALTDHHLPYAVVRFPDFLGDGGALYETLRFPEPVTRERMLEVFDKLRNPELVSNWR